eukprot:105295-Chlamydomonas_euryale.AAC.1
MQPPHTNTQTQEHTPTRAAGCRVGCYVHYPTISSDMIARVASGAAGYNNSAAIAGSSLRSFAKLAYYQAFAAVYGL